MKTFITHFARQPDGTWICTSPGEFQGPSGPIHVAAGSRFAPGTACMGVDLAKLLEEEFVRPTIGVPIVARIADIELGVVIPEARTPGLADVFPKTKPNP